MLQITNNKCSQFPFYLYQQNVEESKVSDSFSDTFSNYLRTFASETNKTLWTMTFLNQFHKEVTERKMRKIAESQQSPMSSADFANYMKRNLELAKRM